MVKKKPQDMPTWFEKKKQRKKQSRHIQYEMTERVKALKPF